MTSTSIARHRLASQHLLGSTYTTATDLVAHFGAVQGQEYGPTKWGLGLRLPLLLDGDIEQELQAGKLVRTHALRSTWHLVAARDIRWLLPLTAPRVHGINAYMYRKLELDAPLFRRSAAVLARELEGGKHLTRETLNVALREAGILADGHRLSYLMMHAELEGLVCSGPRVGKQFTYMLLDARVPPSPPLSPEEALEELSRRYFHSRGPATVRDFATWSGLTLTACKRGVAALGNALETILANGDVYYGFPPDGIPPQQSERMHLLPLYDEYIMGYKDRSCILTYRNSLSPAPKARYDNLVVWSGQVIGSWRRVLGKGVVDVELDFFQVPEEEQQAALERELGRYGEFMGMEVRG